MLYLTAYNLIPATFLWELIERKTVVASHKNQWGYVIFIGLQLLNPSFPIHETSPKYAPGYDKCFLEF